jgi:hypothetical protein
MSLNVKLFICLVLFVANPWLFVTVFIPAAMLPFAINYLCK